MPHTIGSVATKLREAGHSVPRTMADIPGLPYESIEALKSALRAGEVRLQRFSTAPSSSTLKLTGSPMEQRLATLYAASIWLLPILCIFLAIAKSAWWLIGCVVIPVVAFRATKRLYSRAVYRAALAGEEQFCFLYFLGEISLTSPDYRTSWYWRKDASHSA
jgi:hypothetical protein